MADKVLWKTGDTITADKLNGSGVFVLPVEVDESTDDMTMPNVTAKQIVDGLQAGAYPVGLAHGGVEGVETWRTVTISECAFTAESTPATVFVTLKDGDEKKDLQAEYPDGTFSGEGGESPK